MNFSTIFSYLRLSSMPLNNWFLQFIIILAIELLAVMAKYNS